MAIGKRTNLGFSSGVPLILKDRFFGVDYVRDAWYQTDLIGQLAKDIFKGNIRLSGGVVSQGAGDTLNITVGYGYVKYNVTIPDTWSTLPPPTTTAAVDLIKVSWAAQTNLVIPSATLNGIATNYVKVAYTEADGNTRTRDRGVGTYPYEVTPSYVITVDAVAPTAYEIVLATFVGSSGGSFTFTQNDSYNLGIGPRALDSVTTGTGLTAFGVKALSENTTGVENTAFGKNALAANTTGYNNSAFGYNTLPLCTEGLYNSAFGSNVLAANTTGIYNSGFGTNTLAANTTGANNCAFGSGALDANTTGSSNCAFGSDALGQNTTANNNAAFGNNALSNNTTGTQNTAMGAESLTANTTGVQNTCIGYNSGDTITTGTNDTCLGYNAQASSGTVSNEFTLGNSSVTNLRCNDTTISALSDIRDKADIMPLDLGLDFIKSLRPSKYRWNRREWYAKKDDNGNPIFDEQKQEYVFDKKMDGSLKSKEWSSGFIAQELEEVVKKFGAEYLRAVTGTDYKKEVAPAAVFMPLIKAVQELADRVEVLEGRK